MPKRKTFLKYPKIDQYPERTTGVLMWHVVFWSVMLMSVSGCHNNSGSVIWGKCDVHETLKLCKANCKSGEIGPKLFYVTF